MAVEERLESITEVMSSVFVEELGRRGGLLDQEDDVMRAGIRELLRRAFLAARLAGAL